MRLSALMITRRERTSSGRVPCCTMSRQSRVRGRRSSRSRIARIAGVSYPKSYTAATAASSENDAWTGTSS